MEEVAPEFQQLPASLVESWTSSSPKALKSALAGKEQDSVWILSDSEHAWGFLHEMVWLGVLGRVSAGSIALTLKSTEKEEKKAAAVASLLTDVLWYVEIQVSQSESEEEKQLSSEWKRLCEVVQAVAQAGMAPQELLLERLGLKLLEGAGFGSATMMQKKLVRGNTNKFFRQRKYNLLGEEPEGYAKLVTELHGLRPGNLEAVTSNMLSLIGFFHLDPNRVFDLILECYEADPVNSAFLDLLNQRSLFRLSNLSQLLGFNFQMHHPTEAYLNPSDLDVYEENNVTPFSLLRITALLISTGRLELDAIYPSLFPPNEVLKEEYTDYLDYYQNLTDSVGAVSLAVRSEKERQEMEEAKEQQEELMYERKRRRMESNQKFGLAAAMLAIGAWKDASSMISRLQKVAGDEVVLDHPLILEQLLYSIEAMIEPVYSQLPRFTLGTTKKRRVSAEEALNQAVGAQLGEKALKPPENIDEFISTAGPMLVMCGHRLSRNVVLFCKVIRIAEHILSVRPDLVPVGAEKGSVGQKNRSMLLRIVDASLLASLPLLPSPNPGVVNELWMVLSHLSCKTRFDLYERWRSSSCTKIPVLHYANAKAHNDAKQVLKRVAKEREVMRLAGRKFAKASHNAPLAAFSALLSNIQSYDNLIPIVVDSIKYASSLSFDVCAYLLVLNLSRDDDKLKDDGTSASHWLQALCKFAGHFYARYPLVELTGLLHYVLRQLKRFKSLDLLILEEIIAKMTGVEVVQDFSDAALRAMGGSDTLRTRARAALGSSGAVKKRSIVRLRSVLEEGGFTIPLLVKTAQQRNLVLLQQPGEKHLKLLTHTYDEATSVFIQFTDLIHRELPITDFTALLPPLQTLCATYHLEPAVAFHLCRPAIRRAEGEQMEDSEWRIGSAEMKQVCPPNVSAELYARFWSLGLYDIFVPRQEYAAEVARVEARLQSLRRGEDPTLTAKRRENEVKRCQLLVEELNEDVQEQLKQQKPVVAALKQAMQEFFPEVEGEEEQTTEAGMVNFVTECVLPRLLFSPEDALFASKFVHLLHQSDVPGFSTWDLVKFTSSIMSNLFCTSEREAQNLGVYLDQILRYVVAWRKDRNTYSKECAPHLGFHKSARSKEDKVSYEAFSKSVDTLFEELTRLFVRALEDPAGMHIRATLIICSKITESYPATVAAAEKMKAIVTTLESSERQDIKLMSKRYLAMIMMKLQKGELRGPKKLAEREQSLKRKLENKKSRNQMEGRASTKMAKKDTDDSAKAGTKKLPRTASQAEEGEIKDSGSEAREGDAQSDSPKPKANGKSVPAKRSRSRSPAKATADQSQTSREDKEEVKPPAKRQKAQEEKGKSSAASKEAQRTSRFTNTAKPSKESGAPRSSTEKSKSTSGATENKKSEKARSKVDKLGSQSKEDGSGKAKGKDDAQTAKSKQKQVSAESKPPAASSVQSKAKEPAISKDTKKAPSGDAEKVKKDKTESKASAKTLSKSASAPKSAKDTDSAKDKDKDTTKAKAKEKEKEKSNPSADSDSDRGRDSHRGRETQGSGLGQVDSDKGGWSEDEASSLSRSASRLNNLVVTRKSKFMPKSDRDVAPNRDVNQRRGRPSMPDGPLGEPGTRGASGFRERREDRRGPSRLAPRQPFGRDSGRPGYDRRDDRERRYRRFGGRRP